MSEIFANIPAIKYEGPESKNPLSFKYYDADRVILGKPMSERAHHLLHTDHNAWSAMPEQG